MNTRTREKPKMTSKQRTLENLRRKKNGQPPLSEESDSGEEGARNGIYDSEGDDVDDQDTDSLFDDKPSRSQRSPESARKRQREAEKEIKKSLRNRKADYDSDFIDDDPNATIGVPSYGLEDIPIEFTSRANLPIGEHFADVVSWMVHKKLSPAFNRNDPVYRVAFERLESHVAGYRDSKFSSSSWTVDFIRALRARPDLYVGEDRGGLEHCEACNRRDRTATYTIQFSGKPYNRMTLDDLESDDDDESGDQDNSEREGTVDTQDNILPAVDRVYHLGRFCYANAETTHSLHHWRHALYQWVLGNLEEEGELSNQRIIQRERWNDAKREKYADKVMEKLIHSRVVESLFRDFKNSLSEAKKAQVSS
jgi:Domain of unknown function (DUF4211)